MFSEGKKEGASTKFGKLHIPFGLWINSPKKQLVKAARRWPSVGSVKSTSSDTASRTSEPPESRPSAPLSAPSRSHRVSQFFGRWSSEKRLVSGGEEEQGGGEDGQDGEGGELSTRPGAPGLLKVYGEGLMAGANYKGVLASRGSSARSLVREALLRYGLPSADPSDYVLCEAVGQGPGGDTAGGWREACRRPVGAHERPLLIQELWRPQRGYVRRFEIRRRDELEREEREEEERRKREEDGGNEGSVVQFRQPRLTRYRAMSGQAPAPGDRGSLRRSISEANLSERRRVRRKNVKSMMVLEREGQAAGQEEEEMGPGAAETLNEAAAPLSTEEHVQSLLRPPSRTPYFILLQGYTEKQDFLIYPMPGKTHTFGRAPPSPSSSSLSPPPPAADTPLTSPDLLPLHCRVRLSPEPGHPSSSQPRARVRPYHGALVTLNGLPLSSEAPLQPGDLLGLGQHILLMYKDPRRPGIPSLPAWLPDPSRSMPGLPSPAFSCHLCGRSLRDDAEALATYLGSREPVLRYQSDDPEEEKLLLEEIVSRAVFLSEEKQEAEAGEPKEELEASFPELNGSYSLAPAYLFALCIQHTTDTLGPRGMPGLLLRIAGLIKKVTWEKIKELGERQPESQPQDTQEDSEKGAEAMTPDLRPLMFWMANAVELLNFAQRKAAEVEGEEDFWDDPSDSQDLESCEEAMLLLDEVIMYTFQQCVYYITKGLYSVLPALLDTNPFAGAAEGAPHAPAGVTRVLSLFGHTLALARRSLLHTELRDQMFGYLFFFCNASLLNTLMERGETGPFYQWTRAVQIRTNLDLVLDWLQAAGLGETAGRYFQKLSATVNLLCVPKTSLLQMSWDSLRQDHSALSSAQLHHLLNNYQLGPSRTKPPAWEPPSAAVEELEKGDIFESFTDHPPLILPSSGFRLSLSEPLPSDDLHGQLQHLRTFLWKRAKEALPANQRPPF
ncbi:ras-interacting protein 1 isoform X1 [Mobula hypostoma]|uniref:ras-interacting protein 1 isoform X1 n=1 Tax=Mobula hypostoma TaxID=723540 RepID=UPI002FC2DAD8